MRSIDFAVCRLLALLKAHRNSTVRHKLRHNISSKVKGRIYILLAMMIPLWAVVSSANAAVVIYTNRAAWEAAVFGSTLITETFDSLATGTANSATLFSSGMTITNGTGTISTLAWTAIGQDKGLELTTASMNIASNFTDLRAFGFDLADNDYVPPEGDVDPGYYGFVDLIFNSTVYQLPFTGDVTSGVTPDDFGFFGVIATTAAEIPSGSFQLIQSTSSMETPHITIDRMTFSSVPEPTTGGLLLIAAFSMIGMRRRKRI